MGDGSAPMVVTGCEVDDGKEERVARSRAMLVGGCFAEAHINSKVGMLEGMTASLFATGIFLWCAAAISHLASSRWCRGLSSFRSLLLLHLFRRRITEQLV